MKNLPSNHARHHVSKPGAGQPAGPDVLEEIFGLLPPILNRNAGLHRMVQAYLRIPADQSGDVREPNRVRRSICRALRRGLEPGQRETGCIFLTMIDGLRTAVEHYQLEDMDELESYFKAHQADFAGRLFDRPVRDEVEEEGMGLSKPPEDVWESSC